MVPVLYFKDEISQDPKKFGGIIANQGFISQSCHLVGTVGILHLNIFGESCRELKLRDWLLIDAPHRVEHKVGAHKDGQCEYFWIVRLRSIYRFTAFGVKQINLEIIQWVVKRSRVHPYTLSTRLSCWINSKLIVRKFLMLLRRLKHQVIYSSGNFFPSCTCRKLWRTRCLLRSN